MNHWLVKSEPGTYSWDDFVRDQRTAWTGVRNYQARNNLKAMRQGDAVFYYHSGDDKRVIGTGLVAREAYPDPTTQETAWCCVDLTAGQPLARPVPLAEIKSDAVLSEMVLAKNSRLSVSPVTPAQSRRLRELGGEAKLRR